jgi:hypothetical protein
MANLIITVIAIALVAVAALMGAYYGGSAYLNNQNAADASIVLNEGAQIAGAWNAYLGDNNDAVPTALSNLTQSNFINVGGYLQAIPQAPQAATGVGSFPVFIGSSGTHYYAYFDVGRHATGVTAGIADPSAVPCIRIQKTATGVTPTVIASAGQGSIATGGNNTFGCAILTGTVSGGLGGSTVPSGDLSTGDYVVEYRLE